MGVKFTYGGDPSKSPRDAVRFYVGDTNESRPLLGDGEVDFALVQKGNNQLLAAAVCADALQGKFASLSNTKVGDVSKNFSDISKAYKELAKTLRGQAALFARPSAPAIRSTTKRALENDTDLIPPEFPLGLGDNPTAIQLNDRLDEADFDGF